MKSNSKTKKTDDKAKKTENKAKKTEDKTKKTEEDKTKVEDQPNKKEERKVTKQKEDQKETEEKKQGDEGISLKNPSQLALKDQEDKKEISSENQRLIENTDNYKDEKEKNGESNDLANYKRSKTKFKKTVFEKSLDLFECPSLNMGLIPDYLEQGKVEDEEDENKHYVYYCLFCSKDEICRYCFKNCHKDCPKHLKLKVGYYDEESTFVCACGLTLSHVANKNKKSKETSISEANKLEESMKSILGISVDDDLRDIIKFYTDKFIDKKKDEIELDKDLLLLEKFSKIKIGTYYQFFDETLKLKSKDYSIANFVIFAFSYIKLNHFFAQNEKFTVTDFNNNNWFHFKSHSEYIKTLLDKEKEEDKKGMIEMHSYQMHEKIKNQITKTGINEKYFNEYVKSMTIYAYYVQMGLAYNLFDIKTIEEIIKKIHLFSVDLYKEFSAYWTRYCNVAKKLFLLQYECVQSYNMFILLSPDKNKPDPIFLNKTLGPLVGISMIKLMNIFTPKDFEDFNTEAYFDAGEVKDPDFYMRLLKDAVFVPKIKKNAYFSYLDNCANSNTYLDDLISCKKEIHDWILNTLWNIEDKMVTGSYSSNNQENLIDEVTPFAPLTVAQLKELDALVQKLYNLIFGENSLCLKPGKNGSTYWIKKKDETFEGEVMEYSGDKCKPNDMIKINLDFTASSIIKVVLQRWFKEDPDNSFKLAESIVYSAINMLIYMTGTSEEGANFFAFGESYEIIEKIVYFEEGYISSDVYTNDKYRTILDKLYEFFSQLPQSTDPGDYIISKDISETINYRSEYFFSLLKWVLIKSEGFRYKQKDDLKAYFNKY